MTDTTTTTTTTSNEMYAAADAAYCRGPDAGNVALYHQRYEEALAVRAAELAAEADEDARDERADWAKALDAEAAEEEAQDLADLTPEELGRGYEDAIALGESAQRLTDLAGRYRAPE